MTKQSARVQSGGQRFAARSTWKRLGVAALTTVTVAGAGLTAVVGTAAITATSAAAAQPVTYTNSGDCVDDLYTVPAGITQLVVTEVGAAGRAGAGDSLANSTVAGGAGGLGSKIQATVPVYGGEVLYVNVAAQYVDNAPQNAGYGGSYGLDTNLTGVVDEGGGGGSASWISDQNPVVNGACSPSGGAILAVAAGGGGGGGAGSDVGGSGGAEGVSSGNGASAGGNYQSDGGGGGGATRTQSGGGGSAGHGSAFCVSGTSGSVGSLLQGGSAGAAGSDASAHQGCQGESTTSGSGGGGGAGWEGGGGGGGGEDDAKGGGGGGAGSSYVASGGSFTSGPALTYDLPSVSIQPGYTLPGFEDPPQSITTSVGAELNDVIHGTGYPLPQLLDSGSSPNGVYFTDNQDGTLTLGGSPTVQSGGVYHVTLTAENTDGNGTLHTATQPLTITVDEAPQWDADQNGDQFQIGSLSSYTYRSSGGYPTPTVTESGTLPAGVTFSDDGRGDAVVSGTPASGAGGVYPVTFTASSGAGLTATEKVSLSVYPLPTALTVHSTANPSTPGQEISISAVSNPAVTQGNVVQFTIDGHLVTQLVQTDFRGVATLPPMSSLSVGPHTITATLLDVGYGYAQSVSPNFTQTVSDTSGAASGTSVSASAVPAPNLVSYNDLNGQVVEKSASGTSLIGVNPTDRGLAVDAAGDIYTVGTDPATVESRIQETTPSGSTTFIGQPFGDSVEGLAVDPAGDVFIANNQELVELTAGGSSRVLLSSGAFATTYDFQGLAVDAAGDVFWTDDYRGNPTGTTGVFELPAPYTHTPALLYSSTDNFQGVAADAAGDVFVADPTGHKVVEITSGGAATTVESGNVPTSVAVDAAGNLYVGLTDANKVVELTSPFSGGSGVTVMAGQSPTYLAAFEPPTAVTAQQPVPLTATVISGPAGGTPTGTVTFKDGTTTLGTGTLGSGTPDTASLTLPAGTLALGAHTITAVYGGSGSWPSSTSTVLTVNVGTPSITVPVTGMQTYGGTPTFADALPTAPDGVTLGGTLSGCRTSLGATAAAGSHPGTISGCGGLTLSGPNAADYSITYADNGFSVVAAPLSVAVTGSEPFSGRPTFSFSGPGALPPGVTGVTGRLSGCATTVISGHPVGSYPGTITGCTGLSASGPSGADYLVTYTDGGFNVVPAAVTVTVTATQPYLGTPAFSGTTTGTLPSGITGVTGTLAGCATTEGASAAAGTYHGTISGCGGEAPSGPSAGEYVVAYVDGGLTVVPLPLAVTVTGTRPLGGPPTFQYAQPATDPAGVTSVTGALSGCSTSTTATTAAASYPNTITGCGGLSAAGPNGADFAVSYTDGGFTVFTNPTGTSLAISPATAPDAYFSESGRYTGTSAIAKMVSPYGSSNVSNYFPSGAYNPGQLAVDAAGDVYVTDLDYHQNAGVSKDKVFKVTPSGTVTTVATGLNGPSAVAVDGQGDVFVADLNNKRIVEVNASGAQTTVMSGIGYPEGVAVDTAGDLFVAEQGPDQILEQALPYSSAPVVVQTVPYPQAVAVDPAGDLFVANGPNGPGGGQNVEEFSPPYTSFNVVASSAQVSDPDGLAVDSAGNLWISDLLGTIDELTEPGQVGSAFHQEYNGGVSAGTTGVGVDTLPTTVLQGQTVSFTSTVISSPPGVSPPGTVTFADGPTQLGTAALNGATPDVATFSTSTLGVGTHSITAIYGGGGGYPASTSDLGTVTVYSPTLDVAVSATQTYGGTPVFTATDPGSLPPGVTITGTLSGCTTTEGNTAAPGIYPGTISGCSGLSLSGANAGTYTLAYVDSGVTVQSLVLTVPVTGAQSYGGAPTFSAGAPASLPPGITGLTGTLAGCSTSVGTSAAPGSYPGTIVGCGGLSPTGTGAANYAVIYTDGGFTVAPAPIIVTVTGTQAFGGTTTFSDQPPALLPNGMAVTGSLSGCTSTVTATTPVGTYPGSISGCGGLSLSGASSADYAIAYVDDPTTVTALSLPVTVTGSQTYGGTPSFAFSAANPLPAGISGITDTLSGCVTSEPATAHVGSSAGTISGCEGLSPIGSYAADYTVTYVGGALTVTPATLAVVPADQSRNYGAAAPTFTYTVSGLENGDSVATALTVDPTCAPTSTAPGIDAITCRGGMTSSDYVLDESATARYQVGRPGLTVTADGQSSTYGQGPPALTATYAGFVNGDDASSLTSAPICTTTATASSPVGSYPITCSGAVDATYAISYVPGTLSIGQPALTVTAADQSSTFGQGPPTLTATYAGFVNGDDASSLTSAPVCTTTATASSPVGSYPITCSGAVDANYAISYVAGTLTVIAPVPSAPAAGTGLSTPVTVTGTLTSAGVATFAYTQPSSLPPGITGVSGTLTGCITSASPSTPGTFDGTISGCGGLVPTGPAAAAYSLAYVDGGVHVSPAPAVVPPVVVPPLTPPTMPAQRSYWTVAADGGVFSFGDAHFYGSLGAIHLNQPIVGMAATPDGGGYWMVARDGGVFSFGDAHFYGSTGAIHLNQPIVGMAATPDGGGYWLVAADGGVFSFGDARFFGSTGGIHLSQPILAITPTPDGGGYWMVARDGGIFSFGDARFFGSTGAIHLSQPIVGMAATPDGDGYWLVAADGGIFSFGDARFFGSTGAIHLSQPIVGMAATPDGGGYWMVARDGGIFTFGDAGFSGSTGNVGLNQPIVGIGAT